MNLPEGMVINIIRNKVLLCQEKVQIKHELFS